MPTHTHARPGLALCTLVAFASLAHADIEYRLKLAPDQDHISVSVSLPVKGTETKLQMPNWAPGAYVKANYAGNIANVASAAPVEHPDRNTWVFKTAGLKRLDLTYDVNYSVSKTGRQISGPGTYLYVVDRKLEKCFVSFETPPDWNIATGLDPAGERRFVAPTYDVLADSPVQVGVFNDDVTTVRGVPVHSVTFGAGVDKLDRKKLLETCARIVEAAAELFRGLPYKRYYFLFSVFSGRDGGGGLEHLNSTQISLANGLGPRAVWVIAHEHFHAWNVKRIRPFVLGPFDYIGYPQTHNLWWSEGVTDYYARMLDLRAGLMSESEFVEDLGQNMQQLHNNPARLKVSADEASYRVWEANNSQGFGGLSYYLKGDMVGLCLDLKLRDLTNGRKSLDDVMRELFKQCRNDKPGFGEDDIRKLCIRFGGAEMGSYYDRVARSTEELPFTEALAVVGLDAKVSVTTQADIGCRLTPSTNPPGIELRAVRGIASEAGLEGMDVLVEVDGKPVSADQSKTLLADLKAGQSYKFVVLREGKRVEATVTPAAKTSTTVTCAPMQSPSERQQRLRKGWQSGK